MVPPVHDPPEQEDKPLRPPFVSEECRTSQLSSQTISELPSRTLRHELLPSIQALIAESVSPAAIARHHLVAGSRLPYQTEATKSFCVPSLSPPSAPHPPDNTGSNRSIDISTQPLSSIPHSEPGTTNIGLRPLAATIRREVGSEQMLHIFSEGIVLSDQKGGIQQRAATVPYVGELTEENMPTGHFGTGHRFSSSTGKRPRSMISGEPTSSQRAVYRVVESGSSRGPRGFGVDRHEQAQLQYHDEAHLRRFPELLQPGRTALEKPELYGGMSQHAMRVSIPQPRPMRNQHDASQSGRYCEPSAQVKQPRLGQYDLLDSRGYTLSEKREVAESMCAGGVADKGHDGLKRDRQETGSLSGTEDSVFKTNSSQPALSVEVEMMKERGWSKPKSVNTERLNATATNMLAEYLRSNRPDLAQHAYKFWNIPALTLDRALSDMFIAVHKPGIPEYQHNGSLDYSGTTLKSYLSSLGRVYHNRLPLQPGFSAEPFKSGVAVTVDNRICLLDNMATVDPAVCPRVSQEEYEFLWNAVAGGENAVQHVLRLFLVTSALLGDVGGTLHCLRCADFERCFIEQGPYRGRCALFFRRAGLEQRLMVSQRVSMYARKPGQSTHNTGEMINSSMSMAVEALDVALNEDRGFTIPSLGGMYIIDAPEFGAWNNYAVLLDFLTNRPSKAPDDFWLSSSSRTVDNRAAFYDCVPMGRSSVASLTLRLYCEVGKLNEKLYRNHSFFRRTLPVQLPSLSRPLQPELPAESRQVTNLAAAPCDRDTQLSLTFCAVGETAATQAGRGLQRSCSDDLYSSKPHHPSELSVSRANVQPDLRTLHLPIQSRPMEDERPDASFARSRPQSRSSGEGSQPQSWVCGPRKLEPQQADASDCAPGVRIVVKIGGSVLTDKRVRHQLTRNEEFEDVMQRVARAWHTCRKGGHLVDPAVSDVASQQALGATVDVAVSACGGDMILCHGAGSFGHLEASEFGIQHGDASAYGMASTHAVVAQLGARIVESLLQQKVPAVSVSPLTVGLVYQAEMTQSTIGGSQSDNGDGGHGTERLGECIAMVSARLVRLGVLPVVHGDVVYNCATGRATTTRIVSADEIVAMLAKRGRALPNVERAVYLSDVRGVYDRAPVPLGRDTNSANVRNSKVDGKYDTSGCRLLEQVLVDSSGHVMSWGAQRKAACLAGISSGVDTSGSDATGGMDGKLKWAGRLAAQCRRRVDVYIASAYDETTVTTLLDATTPDASVQGRCTRIVSADTLAPL